MSKRTFQEMNGPCTTESTVKPENKMTIDNLPENVIHLGNTQFIVVRSYQGHTRIHVRKFIEDDQRQLQPTKDGVSLPPKLWVAFTEKLPKLIDRRSRIYDNYPHRHVEVLDRDLCVFKDINAPNEKCELMLQRMFQRRDRSYQLVPEVVRLDEQQCHLLLGSAQRVKVSVEVSLLTKTLRHHVEKLVKQQASPESLDYFPSNYHMVVGESMDSLRKVFLDLITLKFKDLAPCYGCEEAPCSCHTSDELLNTYFDLALYEISYSELAQKFIAENINRMYFVNLILCRDFFSMINVPSFLNEVKNMFAPSEEYLCEMSEFC